MVPSFKRRNNYGSLPGAILTNNNRSVWFNDLLIEGNLNVLLFTGKARAAYPNRVPHRSRT